MKKKSADLISRVVQYMKDNPTIAAWINLVVSIIIAVLIVLILLFLTSALAPVPTPYLPQPSCVHLKLWVPLSLSLTSPVKS